MKPRAASADSAIPATSNQQPATTTMERENIWRRMFLFAGAASWIFLLLALGSFHRDDWPSHQVYPYPAIQNLCGKVGAFFAYHIFLVIGQGVFPILFFSGICLALYLF